ncbi:MAG: guanylate kinase [Oscillospiraceae bacterium]|nr:guanylate kinase [Oscillospiraceae bacterium]MDE5885857.1 guanylate kinase [Oscillospiraceae bacterium]
MQKSLLIVVSAPSGCGKGTILGQILKDEKYYYSVSATTRAPRQGEMDGVHYRFMPKEQFEQLISENAFLEYAPYCDHYYGTLKQPIEDALAQGRHVILEIEVQGAMQIRKLVPDAKFIFIAPPDLETLRQRLTARGTESEDVITKRITQAARELQYKEQYDYCIVNDVLEDAIADFRSVIRAEELKIN